MIPALAYRFLHRPLAIAPGFAEPLVAAIVKHDAALSVTIDEDPYLPAYEMLEDMGVVPVRGALLHTGTLWGAIFGGETTYDRIQAGVMGALADPACKAIVLDIESPGGEVDGCFELAEIIYQARGQKPIVAICDPYAYSAAYAIASAAEWICVPRTGGAGSVGVISVHMEFSKMLAEVGIGVTVVQYGEQKAERGPFAPLSADAHDRLQAEVDEIGKLFVTTVARNRGMSPDAVRATKAGTLMGEAAVKAGLADEVAPPQEAFVSLIAKLKG